MMWVRTRCLSLLLKCLTLTRVTAQRLYLVSSTRISGRSVEETLTRVFPMNKTETSILEMSLSGFCGSFYHDQLIENIVGIFKLLLIFLSGQCFALTL